VSWGRYRFVVLEMRQPLRYARHWKAVKRAVKTTVPKGSEMSAESGRTLRQRLCPVRQWARYVLLTPLRGQVGGPDEGGVD
jgi:hypothetical protein